jgi:hypothetical protein
MKRRDEADRAQLVAEAIKREPELANAATPEQFQRLRELTDSIAHEHELAVELERVRRTQEIREFKASKNKSIVPEARDRWIWILAVGITAVLVGLAYLVGTSG